MGYGQRERVEPVTRVAALAQQRNEIADDIMQLCTGDVEMDPIVKRCADIARGDVVVRRGATMGKTEIPPGR